MKSLTTLSSLFNTLAQNQNTTTATALGKQLINDQHRYLIQKYFDNERVFTTLTVGAMDIVLGTSPVVQATSATLSVAWPYLTCRQLVVFEGSGEQRTVRFVQNSTSITWDTPLWGQVFDTTDVIPAAATSATLSTAWEGTTGALTAYFSDGESKTVTFTNGSTTITWAGGLTGEVEAWVRTYPTNTDLSTIGVQAYSIPANISKIKNNTITVGQLVYTPAPIQTIQEWTMLNALPYTSDIPNYYFIYQGEVLFWPIPSTSGNLISFTYQARVADLSYSDYTTGTITSAAVGSNSITGSLTSWNTGGTFPANVDLSFANLFIKIDPPKGDGIWYPINRFTGETTLLLNGQIQNAPNISSATYTIGQFPLLHEDFHDMLVYGALMVYFTSIVKDKEKFAMYKALYEQKEKLMEAYLGTKSVNVDLGSQIVPNNPNLFIFAPPQS